MNDRRLRVAIVDDNYGFCRTLQMILEDVAEVTIIPIEDVFDENMWERMNPDVAFVDLNLGTPRVTGIDVLRWLSLNFKHVDRYVITAETPNRRTSEAIIHLGLAREVIDKMTNTSEWKRLLENGK